MSRCAHCMRPALTPLAIGKYQLCHPPYGLDCYELVTIAKHGMPCNWCMPIRLDQDNQRRWHAFPEAAG
jgi:hypothetical protein